LNEIKKRSGIFNHQQVFFIYSKLAIKKSHKRQETPMNKAP